MANQGRFPKPYVDSVPAEGTEKVMEYVPLDNMGIGARKSGTPKGEIAGIRSLDHVGGTTGSRK